MVAFEIPILSRYVARSQDGKDEQELVRRWVFEESMVRIRWSAIPISLLLIPLFSTVSVPLVFTLVMMIGAGNAWMAKALGGVRHASRLNLVRWLATVLDWSIGVGSLAMFSPELSNWTPALLLLLIVTTAFRFGIIGLVIAAGLAIAVVTGMVVAQIVIFEVYDALVARITWLGWTLLIVTTTAIGSGLIRSIAEFDRWERERWNHYGSVLPRFQLGISQREWELLPMLAHDDLTYRQIAEKFHLSPETIKTHVRHLSEKLGVSGRRQVVAAARQHKLLPSASDVDKPL